MSSTSTMSPNTTHIPCTTEWPALSTTNIASSDSDWELLPEDNEGSFHLVEPVITDLERVDLQTENATKTSGTINDKPHCLKHAQSTPDFGSLASSSMVMVSGPASIISSQSCWTASSGISFRDAIMKEKNEEAEGQATTSTTGKGSEGKVPQPKIVRKKPTFVVKPITRRFSSMGDLQSLARIVENGDEDLYNNDLILGDTDAELYYSRKAQGKLGRKNGRKIRPDEAKRLQMTMDKKDAQRQRQQQATASKKR